MPLSEYPKTMKLPDGAELTVRPMNSDDGDRLGRFFQALPKEDRLFMKHDVTQREVIEGWVRDIDYDRVFPLLALDGEEVVADATLHFSPAGWSRHVGEIRMAVAARFQDRGLRRMLSRELAARAVELGLDKIQYLAFEGHQAAITLCQRLGLTQTAVLPGLLKDWRGRMHNMVVMVNDVDEFSERMEDIVRHMGPRFRVDRSARGQ